MFPAAIRVEEHLRDELSGAAQSVETKGRQRPEADASLDGKNEISPLDGVQHCDCAIEPLFDLSELDRAVSPSR
jgi:hypothetical protein